MIHNLTDIYPINCESVMQPTSADSINSEDFACEYYFSNDWISSQYDYWIEIIKPYTKVRRKINILQAGVFEGRMTVFLYNHILVNRECVYYCVDNFGESENQYLRRESIDRKYDSLAARRRFTHNTKRVKNLKLFDCDLDMFHLKLQTQFDIIILDTDDKKLLSDVLRLINFMSPICTLLVTYEISISQMAKLKRSITHNFKVNARYNRDKTFDCISIQSSTKSDIMDLHI